jgi:hypothetical protein
MTVMVNAEPIRLERCLLTGCLSFHTSKAVTVRLTVQSPASILVAVPV